MATPRTRSSPYQHYQVADCPKPKECGKCGDYTHLAKDCPHANKQCSICGKIGHRKMIFEIVLILGTL